MHVRPGYVPEVIKNLQRLSGVKEAHMTFGPYDVVAVISAEDVHHLGKMVYSEIQSIPGIIDTLTCLIVEQP